GRYRSPRRPRWLCVDQSGEERQAERIPRRLGGPPQEGRQKRLPARLPEEGRGLEGLRQGHRRADHALGNRELEASFRSARGLPEARRPVLCNAEGQALEGL